MDFHTLYNWEHVMSQQQRQTVRQAEQTRLRKAGAHQPDRDGRLSQAVVGLVKSAVARLTLLHRAWRPLPR